MSQNSVYPQFSDVGFLISELGGNCMAEGVERHILGNTDTFFMLRESPRKIVSALTCR